MLKMAAKCVHIIHLKYLTVLRGATGGPRVEDHLCWLSRVRGLRPDAGHRVRGSGAGGATQVCLWGRSAGSGQDSRDRRGRRDGYSADVRLQRSGVHPGGLLRLQWLRRPGADREHARQARLRPPHPKHTCIQPARHQVQDQLGQVPTHSLFCIWPSSSSSSV